MASEELLKDGSSKLNKAVEKGDKRCRYSSNDNSLSHFKIEKLRREVDKVRESQKQNRWKRKKESKSRSSTARKEKSTDKVKVPSSNKRKTTEESTSSKKHKNISSN